MRWKVVITTARVLVLFLGVVFLSYRSSAMTQPEKKESAAPTPVSSAEDEYREDFTELSLKGSLFFPLEPALGQVDDDKKFPFIRERWQLDWRPADPIDVYICKPRGAQKAPVILYLYTSPGTTDRFKSDDWCGTTTANGFAAVGFLSAYTGHRLEMRNPTSTFFTNFQESIAASVHDVQLILDYLATRKDLDMSRVGMYGQGSGGTIAILASVVDARIQALDVLTPWGDWPNFFTQPRFISEEQRKKFSDPAFLASIAPLEPLQWLPKVKAKSLRIQDVRKSGPMPDKSQEHLESVAPEKGIINQFGDPAALVPHASGGALFEWLHAQLQLDPKSQVALDKSERIHFYPALGRNPLPPLGPPAKN